jgi:hypothetical protein
MNINLFSSEKWRRGRWQLGRRKQQATPFFLGSPFLARVSAIVGLNRKRQLVTVAQTWLVRLFISKNSTVILKL